MTLPRLATCLLILALLTACSTPPRYVVESPPPVAVVRVPMATLEVKDLVLPGHASGSEILIETAEGGLVALSGAIWADDPVRAHAATLARALDIGSTARVAAAPWPLTEPPQAELTVRIDRMLGQDGGLFTLDAQVAVTSRDGVVADRIERLSVTTPLDTADAAGVVDATGSALRILAQRILALLEV